MIGHRTFSRCLSLTGIVLPSGVELVEVGAFYRCNGLEIKGDMSRPLSLGDYAFWGCESLRRIALPDVCSFGKAVFGDCVAVDTEKVGSVSARLYVMKAKITVPPEGEETGVRWIYPRHWTY